MSTDPLADIEAAAAHAYRNRHQPPAPTVVSHAMYEAVKNDPAPDLQQLIESGAIIAWDTAEDRIADLLRDSGLSFSRGPNIRYWPESEQAVYRDGRWNSFTERDDAVQEFRIRSLARAIVEQEGL